MPKRNKKLEKLEKIIRAQNQKVIHNLLEKKRLGQFPQEEKLPSSTDIKKL